MTGLDVAEPRRRPETPMIAAHPRRGLTGPAGGYLAPMDGERRDETQERHRGDELQGDTAESGYPEEGPPGAEGSSQAPLDRSGAEPTEEPDSPPGASGEGTQSTGNPRAAG
jgi:hypothetical protein